MIAMQRIVSRFAGQIAEIRTDVPARGGRPGSRTAWLVAMRRHELALETWGEGGRAESSECQGVLLQTEVECEGTTLLVETCCDHYQSSAECVEAHVAKVMEAEEGCGE